MRAFWVHSGLALLDEDAAGQLQVTDDFLRAYLRRPELALEDESCAGENQIHAFLQQSPRGALTQAMLEAIEDQDVRDNWRLFAAFRQYLLETRTIEEAYCHILVKARAAGKVDVPPLFVEQLSHIILHQALVQCEDGLTLRVAELLFRDQQVSLMDGHAMLADAETVEFRADSQGLGDLGRLLAKANVKARDVDLDVLDVDNASEYFGRDERHDFAIDLAHGRQGAERLCVVLSAWVKQVLGVVVRVRTLKDVSDHRWRWHIGLSAEGSTILNKLYNEEAIEPTELRSIVWLGRIDFEHLPDQRADVGGKPVYLALAMREDGQLRFKPQNLVLNLPLAKPIGAASSQVH
jgi:Family of unknown function (DUF6352)